MTKLPFILSLVAIAVLVVATFAEPLTGHDVVHRMVYEAWWFRTLWGAMAASGLWLCIQRKMWKRPVTSMLHMSFIIILVGAITTALTRTEGHIEMYEGQDTTMFLTHDQHVSHLNFTLHLDSFRIDRYDDNGAPSGYRSHVTITDHDGTRTSAVISMNHILRHRQQRIYQTSYKSAPSMLNPNDRKHEVVLTVVNDPYGIGITYAGYALLLFSCILRLLPRHQLRPNTKKASIGTIVIGASLIYTLRWTSAEHLLPVLRSPLLAMHVSIIIVAYILFLLMALGGILRLTRYDTSPTTFSARPLLKPAVLSLCVGIFLGAVWANVSWGSYWSWDPKEVWALITMLVYALPLHTKSIPWLADERRLHLYFILAFACVLITYFGVNLILGGMHSYAN